MSTIITVIFGIVVSVIWCLSTMVIAYGYTKDDYVCLRVGAVIWIACALFMTIHP